MGVTEKADVQGPSEYAFVRAKPLEALFRRAGQRLVRYRAFRGPQSSGFRSEDPLVVQQRALQLLAGISRPAVGPARKGRAPIPHTPDIQTAQQRHNRV